MPRLDNAQSYAKASEGQMLAKVKEVVSLERARCDLFHGEDGLSQAGRRIPEFDASEITTGRVLGRGGFCVVREITGIKLHGGLSNGVSGGISSSETSALNRQQQTSKVKTTTSTRPSAAHAASMGDLTDADHVEDLSREEMARRVVVSLRGGKRGVARSGGRYVLKRVEPTLMRSDRVTFLKGVIDLALETEYLASLNHRHVLKVRGVCRLSPFDTLDYFLVLDQLVEILPERLNEWMQRKRRTSGVTGLVTGGSRQKQSLFTERIRVAYDIAEVMDFLHSKNIIYRDLKPGNIGFDVAGVLKLFDFGLCKELRDADRDNNGFYRMTGFTGAIRYMAPEVGRKEPYNLKADVYSWSMLMWYFMALEPPMGLYTPNMFIDRVFGKGYRPATKDKWPKGLSSLMKSCWSERISQRPTFANIMVVLKRELSAATVDLDI